MAYRGVILDVDGTVVRGDEPIPGAAAGLDDLRAAGVRRLFVSNNPSKPPGAYAERLGRAGFEVDPDEIVTAGTMTVDYLAAEHPDADLYVVGEQGLLELLEAADLSVVDGDRAEVAVVSLDRGFDYDTLAEAGEVLADRSVRFVGTDPDMLIPVVDRDVPGSGAIVNAVAGVAGRDPDVMLGKPSDVAQRTVLDRLGLDPADCLLVGDRLDTDIELGRRAGMTTALVLTGVTDEADLEAADVDPDFVLDSLGDVGRLLDDSR